MIPALQIRMSSLECLKCEFIAPGMLRREVRSMGMKVRRLGMSREGCLVVKEAMRDDAA